MSFFGSNMSFNDLRNHATFGWMVVGLLISQQVHLNLWALYRPSAAQASSRERQMSRWLHNDKIAPRALYRALITAALVEWGEATVVLALDTSVLWNRFVLVRIALIYRGRALPVVWTVLAHSSASVAFVHYAELLTAAAQVLPLGCRVILLADRGFADVDLMSLAAKLGWHFTIRAKQNVWVYRAFKARCKIQRLMPPPGQIHLFPVVQVTERRFGPVHLALAQVRTPKGCEPWVLISDRPTSLATLDEYALRFDIEESFLDDKSAGFQLHESEVRSAQALERLCLVLAVATLYLVSLGTALVSLKRRALVDPHWQRGLSYFQIGWRYLRRALTHAHRLLTFLWLEADPDPEPVFASKSQALTPTLAFSAIYLLE
jgi:hypothetical protein